MAFDLADYKDVATRIADFRDKYPEGTLQPLNLERPYEIVTVGDDCFVVYVAAAYRTPDDPRPGVGTAWEPYPGKTPYTKLSELQNAETASWGRAIIAVLASESRQIPSREDVRNRADDQEAVPVSSLDKARGDLYGRFEALGKAEQKEYVAHQRIMEWPWIAQMDEEQVKVAEAWLDEQGEVPF